MALVESRSCTNSGSVGTSNESRSALPAQFRNGLLNALRLCAASSAWRKFSVVSLQSSVKAFSSAAVSAFFASVNFDRTRASMPWETDN